MEVKVTKCENGHYYDVNKYDTCPHCGAGEFLAKEPQKKKFGFLRKDTKKTEAKKTDSMQFSKEVAKQAEDLICEDVETVGSYSSESSPVEDVQTQGLFTKTETAAATDETSFEPTPYLESSSLTKGFFAVPVDAKKTDSAPSVNITTASNESDEKTTGFFSIGNASKEVVAETKPASLLEQVEAVTDDNDAKTTGFFAPKKNNRKY